LPRRRFGGLKKAYGNLAISAHSMSEPRIDDERQYPVSEHSKGPVRSREGELIEKALTNEGERLPGAGRKKRTLRAIGCVLTKFTP
jgi:hypothetical protein